MREAITTDFAPRISSSTWATPLPKGGLPSAAIDDRLTNIRTWTSLSSKVDKGRGLPEQLFDTAADFKMFTSKVAMHLEPAWRTKLFSQLDSLLDPDEWDPEDLPPAALSFRTLLRMLLLLRPARKPGLGADHEGHLIAAWTTDENRLTVTCLQGDQVRYVLKRKLPDEAVRSAGDCSIAFLPTALHAYEPHVWFE